MSIEITVRGAYEAFQPPERGTVHVTISFQGPEMEPVYDRVVRDLDAVRASLGPLHNPDGGPVTWWSTQQLRTWSTRPWNKDGKQLPPVHHASVSVDAKFCDFSVLSRWVGEHVTNTAGFRVSGIEWALTATRRDELLSEVRTRAVADAVRRAQEYADALGIGEIRPVAIADAGMLGAGLRPDERSAAGNLRLMAAGGTAPDLEFAPEDIEVSAAVDARFVVGDV